MNGGKEAKVLSQRLLEFIFTQDKASVLCQCFAGLSQNGWAVMTPQFQMNSAVSEVVCVGCHEEERKEQEVSGSGREGKREERKKFSWNNEYGKNSFLCICVGAGALKSRL